MPEVEQALRELTEAVGKVVGDAIADGTAAPEEEVLWQWRVSDFKYTDSGISSSGAGTENVTKKTWFRASIDLRERVSEHQSFKAALEELSQAYPKTAEIRRHLESFTGCVIAACLTDPGRPDSSEMQGITTRFINDLAGGPATYKARVELQGVTLRPERVSLDVGLSMRQPKKEDLEVAVRPGFHQPLLANPSAIVEVEFVGPRPPREDRAVRCTTPSVRRRKRQMDFLRHGIGFNC